MLRISTNFVSCTLEKLQTVVTPLIIPVRFRLWSERQPVMRRYGYEDKMDWRGPLPRTGSKIPLPKPPYAPKNKWAEKQALFGQNDYIDILGDGNIHPAKISYNIPHWLRGFRGNEYQMLIRKRKLFGHAIRANSPDSFKAMKKRLKYLYGFLNRNQPYRINWKK